MADATLLQLLEFVFELSQQGDRLRARVAQLEQQLAEPVAAAVEPNGRVLEEVPAAPG